MSLDVHSEQLPNGGARATARVRTAPAATLRLCFVKDSWAWFTDAPFADVRGDDWNDAPHDCNAGEPHASRGTRFTKVAFDGDLNTAGIHGCINPAWDSLSVDDINSQSVPWLFTWDYVARKPKLSIYAHEALEMFTMLVEDAGGQVYT